MKKQKNKIHPRKTIHLRNKKREFDLLEPLVSERISVRPALESDFPAAIKLGDRKIPGGVSSSLEAREAVLRNKHNLYLFWHGENLVGLYAMLMLTPIGLERLLLGQFDASHPDPICLTETEEIPAAIYKWAVVAPGLAAEGIRHMSVILRRPQFQHANFFSRPNTVDGIRINLNLGFRPVPSETSNLYRYIRLANRPSFGKSA